MVMLILPSLWNPLAAQDKKDSTAIYINTREEFPKFGRDERGKLYFVLSESQEKEALTDLMDYDLLMQQYTEAFEKGELQQEKIDELGIVIQGLEAEIELRKKVDNAKDRQIEVLQQKVEATEVMLKAQKKETNRQKRLKIGGYIVGVVGILSTIVVSLMALQSN
ncbi:MAG: hypothetical protein H6620_12750 [Halobacteriovoraceae bacterium]|nr:hypothetical protein [Halobacteriovoraceae bacterium]